MTSKPWQLSKTVWFNIVTMLLAIIPIIGAFVKLIEPQTAVIIDGGLTMLGGIGNVVLRVWFTDQPITTAKSMAAGYDPRPLTTP